MSIKLRSVRKSHKNKNILSGVSIDIKDGEFVVISSENEDLGTTLLHILGGVEKPTSGAITLSGYDVEDFNEKERADFYRNSVCLIDIDRFLQPKLNVRNNISLPGMFSGLSKKDLTKRIETLSKKYKVSKVLKAKVSQLNPEQIERIVVARALFMNPKIILIDNPSGIIIECISEYLKENEAIVIVSSNDESIKKLASQVIIIKDGKVAK
jgi:putative ABC transport system ATP-binding protein